MTDNIAGAAESRDSARASFSPADPLPDSPVRRFERASPPKRYRRKRDSSSPFIAGFRPPRQRQLSSSFSNRPSYRSPKRNSSHSSLLRTPEQLRQPLACVSTTEASIENIPRLSATGAKQFLFDTESPSSASGTHRTSPSDPFVSARVPKKVVRADDFWQKDRPKGPSVPEKSPLRDLLGPLDALRIRPLSPLTDPSDDEVRVKLRPSPLKLSKPALHSLSKRSFLGKTEGPEGAQAQLQPARKEVSPRTHDFLLKKAISKSSITESDKGELAEEVEALESDWIRRNRKLTLEALEGAATPTLEFSPEKLLSMMSRDRNSSLSEHVTKEPRS